MRPAARLIVDGRDISTEVFGPNGILVSLSITDEAGVKSDTLELEIDNRESFKAPPKGAEIQAWLGYEPQPTYMGRFKVDEWEKRGPAKTLRVTARAAELTTEIRAAKTRDWDDKTVGEIVQKIAKDHGLTASVSGSLASIKVKHIDQQNESDLGFLSRLAKRVGATFKLADGKVLFAEKGSSSLPSGGEKTALRLTPAMVGDWSASSAERGSYKSVICLYVDHAKGARKRVTEGSGKPCHRDRRLYATEVEARAAAKAQLGDLTRGKVSFQTTGPGMPDVFAEGLVSAEDFDPDVDGEYLIKSVQHSFDSSGFTTSLSMETKGSGGTEATSDE